MSLSPSGNLHAVCTNCGLVTGDPDAHFWPPDGDEEVLPDDYLCPDGQLHVVDEAKSTGTFPPMGGGESGAP